jgi:hypothetical protein
VRVRTRRQRKQRIWRRRRKEDEIVENKEIQSLFLYFVSISDDLDMKIIPLQYKNCKHFICMNKG